MKRIKKATRMNDAAVSPVIGTILMVAVTVMLSGGVYVWTTVFSNDTPPPESVSIRATGADRDGDGLVEWVRLTLVSAQDAPYNLEMIGMQWLPPEQPLVDETTALCAAPAWNSVNATCANPTPETWSVGQSLFIPCFESGKHLLTLNIRGHTVLDNSIQCNEDVVEAAP